jgi:hypothetical protein
MESEEANLLLIRVKLTRMKGNGKEAQIIPIRRLERRIRRQLSFALVFYAYNRLGRIFLPEEREA